MANVRGNGAQVTRAIKDLGEAWGMTESGWRDQAHRQFAEQYLEQLEQRATQAVRAITSIEDLLQEAERQCS